MSRYIDKETMRGIIREQEKSHGIRGLAWIEMAMDKQEDADVQEVRHGKWIYCGHHEFHGHVFECSVCGRYLFANSKEDVYVEYPYCHCGTKMDEEEQE